jgi:hypothetical protein
MELDGDEDHAVRSRRLFDIRKGVRLLSSAGACLRPLGGASSENLIVESNSIAQFLAPDDLYLVVLDGAQPDFKASSRRFLERADACVVIDRGAREPQWTGVSRELWENKPRFGVSPPQYMTAALSMFVDERLTDAAACARNGSATP